MVEENTPIEMAFSLAVGAIYFAGFCWASAVVWRESHGRAGIGGLPVAIVWPIWLPIFFAVRAWRKRS